MRPSWVGRAVCTASIALCTGLPSWGQQHAPKNPNPPQTPIRVQSSLVLVDVITQESKTGLPVRDFKKEDFRLFNDGVEVAIDSFDAGAKFDTRPVIIWLVVLCNGDGIIGGSKWFVGNEAFFRPAFDHLDKNDTVGVAHWCDDGATQIDLLPTVDHDSPIKVLAETIQPISYHGRPASGPIGEVAFRKLIREIIQDAHRRNPQPLPVIVFLDADYTGQFLDDLNDLVNDFLETSGIVFGIKDQNSPPVPQLHYKQGEIEHYMADQTGGQFFSTPPAGYSPALEEILMQLHFRYQLGFIPPAIDGKRHELKVVLTKEAQEKHKKVRLRFRPEYIPVPEVPAWAQ
jgi:hypothetical protein